MKAVILAGGSGNRLWPLSNQDTPKQLLKIDDQYSLLQNTFLRLNRSVPAGDILTVTNVGFAEKTAAQLQEISPASRLLCEPCARNTAPAIACALEFFRRQSGDDTVIIAPADHLIKEVDSFCQTVEKAAAIAEKGYIVTLGIKPDCPETGFGYIKTAEVLDAGFKVEKFVEKPTLEVAKEYVAAGTYFWNGGIFIGKISVFMEEFRKFSPQIVELAEKCAFSGSTIESAVFEKMPKISIDYAVMEKSDRIALVKMLSDWSDLGSWQAIYELKDKDENGNVVIGKAILHDVRNSLIYSPDAVTAVSDVENRVLVTLDGIVMSCELTRSQNVKILCEKFR